MALHRRTRKLNRMRGYDYTNDGLYFVTICVQHRECVFGEIEDEKIKLNQYGKIVENCWYDLPNHYTNCRLDEFIIMPNHVHGIIKIDNNNVGNGLKPFPNAGNETDISFLDEFSNDEYSNQTCLKTPPWDEIPSL